MSLADKLNGDFEHNKIIQALMMAEDILDRAHIPFIVLGEIAYQMKNNLPLKYHKVVVGVMYRYAVPECTSLLKTIDKSIETTTDGWRIVKDGVPVIIKVIHKNYPTLMDPDHIFYAYDPWPIPNPFDIYWQGKDHYDI